MLKNWCFWSVVLEETLESPLDCKDIQPVHPKENQSWKLIERTGAEAETPILLPPDVKNWLIWKDPDAGKDWRQEKGMVDGWMVSPTRWTWVWVNSGSWLVMDREAWCAAVHGVAKVGHDWVTELNWVRPTLPCLNHLPRQCWVNTTVSVGWEDSLEKERATHSSILAWESHGQRSLVGYSPWGH